MFTRIKKSINNFLDKIAKQNEELYGKRKMDCCNLNKQNENKSIRKKVIDKWFTLSYNVIKFKSKGIM